MSDDQVTDATAPKGRAGFPRKGKLFSRNAEAVRNFPALPDDAFTTTEVIAILDGCSIQTVMRRAKTGVGPRIITIGGQARINVGEYRRLNERRLAAPASAQPEAVAA
jgi:hypothetical protein